MLKMHEAATEDQFFHQLLDSSILIFLWIRHWTFSFLLISDQISQSSLQEARRIVALFDYVEDWLYGIFIDSFLYGIKSFKHNILLISKTHALMNGNKIIKNSKYEKKLCSFTVRQHWKCKIKVNVKWQWFRFLRVPFYFNKFNLIHKTFISVTPL